MKRILDAVFSVIFGAALVYCCVGAALAQDFPNGTKIHLTRPVDGGQLRVELEKAGCVVDESRTSWSDLYLKASGCDATAILNAHVDVDPVALSKTARSQATALAKKLKAGTITAAEKDALLLRLCFIVISQDQ